MLSGRVEAVVHEEDLGVHRSQLAQKFLQPGVELGNDLLFVVDRKDEAQRRARHGEGRAPSRTTRQEAESKRWDSSAWFVTDGPSN